ncbi:MAG: porin [Pirellulales bacterium]|nr:porin [Pirellulales bacterium]
MLRILPTGFICGLWLLASVRLLAEESHQTPADTLTAIEARLAEQQAEISSLRGELRALRQADALDASRTAISGPPPEPPLASQLLLISYEQDSAKGNNADGEAEKKAPADPQTEIADLKKRLEKLESAAAKSSKEKKEADDWVDVSKEKWTVKLGGHIQMDYVTWAQADPAIIGAQNYFNFRRLRLVADGTGYGVYDFRLQMTLEPGQGINQSQFASPDVKDAYVSMNEIPWLGRFRIGNFFVPFSLEQVTNDTNNIFLERSIPTQGIFAADREVGVAFYNCTADQNITWCGGMFFDDINDTEKTRFDDNQGYRLSGRLTWLPYYDEPSNGRYLVHTGVGVLHTNDFDDRVSFRARPQVQRGPILINSGTLLADTYTTGNLELAIVWGRVTLQNEAFISSVDLDSGDTEQVGGAYSHISYFLTGENRVFERFGQHGAQFARNVPYTNFFATPGGWGSGAWEAKARWSYLDLANTDSGQYNDLTVGFNWYWTDRMRIMFDWIHPVTTSETVFGATESDLIAMRYDVNW